MPATATMKCLTASFAALTLLGLTTQVASAACQLGSAREPINHVMVFTLPTRATTSSAARRAAAHFDSAPTIHINGNPGQFAPTTFGLEVAMSGVVAINPITQNQDELAVAFADRTTMKLLHMVTQDPARTPSFTMFGDPDYFFLTSPTSTCSSPANCVVEAPAFAWNHGDIQPEITTTWLGMAGPGVRHLGVTRSRSSRRRSKTMTRSATRRPSGNSRRWVRIVIGLPPLYAACWTHQPRRGRNPMDRTPQA